MKHFRILLAAVAALAVSAFVAAVLHAPGTVAQDDATPEATDATPVAEGTPEAEPIRVVTLVTWYQTDPSGDFIQLGPMATNDQLIAGPGDTTNALTGRADFDGDEENNNMPRIELGDSTFNGVPGVADDPETVFRWIYPENDATIRPATLVIQIVAESGPYEGFSGSATFISRSSPGSGVLVIMLNPPEAE